MTNKEIITDLYKDVLPESWEILGSSKLIDLVDINISAGVLDIGCGSGKITELLSYECEHILAVDIQDQMIEFARENHSRPNIEYLCADFMDLQLSENAYNVVIANNSFFNVEDKLALLTKVRFILKQGGTLIFSDITDRLNQDMPEGYYCISVTEYLNLLNTVGFSNITFISEENKIRDGQYSGTLQAIFKMNK